MEETKNLSPFSSIENVEENALYQKSIQNDDYPVSRNPIEDVSNLPTSSCFIEEVCNDVESSEYFEGPEKSLDVQVLCEGNCNKRGLRALTRFQLDEICKACDCNIVSTMHKSSGDAYVLSESSLFVTPNHFLIKTCGQTRVLASLPILNSYIEDIGMRIESVSYWRRTFTRPEEQPFPHRSFEEEMDYFTQV